MPDKPFSTIPNDSNIRDIEYHPHYSCICSVGKTPFHGTMDIYFRPISHLLEFMSFEEWLLTLSNKPMTIEELTRLVYNELEKILKPTSLHVTVHAETVVHGRVSAGI